MESREQCLAYIGSSFRVALRVPERMTDVQVGQFLLDNHFLVHLSPSKGKQKFDLLTYFRLLGGLLWVWLTLICFQI